MPNFDEFKIKEELIKALNKNDINTPTEIQEKVIPLAMEGKNIIGQSPTGTGKTLAYLLPIFNSITENKRENNAVILAPTHELAMQIDNVCKWIIEYSNLNITSAAIIGGVHPQRQLEKLKTKPNIIIASGNRILGYIKDRKISAHTISHIVIDEGDRMVSDSNLKIVEDVIKCCKRDTQIMMFSASITDGTLQKANSFIKEGEVIRIGDKLQMVDTLEHWCFLVEDKREKFDLLRKLLSGIKPQKSMVFLNRSEEIASVVEKLKYHGFMVEGVHGNSDKTQRQRSMDAFRRGKVKILVTSDLAARGIDVKGVTHIFHLDLPEEPKDYLHRSGRAGRAGEKGTSIAIISNYEIKTMQKFDKNLNLDMDVKRLYDGKIYDV